MAEDLAEMYGALAEECGMTLVAEGAVTADVHRELLGQALANLVDNAIKYGRVGGLIRISAKLVGGDRIALSVDDDGPGIPEDRRAEALRRFGRLDPARGAGGAGLGLALAAAVARLHGGELSLADNRPGLSATIALPA
jgi:signal transduction histidine kinase